MLLRLLLALLLVSVVGCAEKGWKTKEYVSVAATHGVRSRPAESRYVLKVLDGVAQLLYADGFLLETNGRDFQPRHFFPSIHC
jgi:hypothetical protein